MDHGDANGATSAAAASASSSSSSTMRILGPVMSLPGVRSAVYWGTSVRTVADTHLPSVLKTVATSGKFSFLIFGTAYLAFVSLWFPFWLLSFLVYENGVYLLFVVAVFAIGRGVIRMIAFPGASHRVESEIEKEFSKYSVRMIVSSANSVLDVASALLEASKMNAGNDRPSSSGTTSSAGSSFRYYEIPGLWKRAKSFRDRVLGVYAEVLSYVLHENNGASANASTNVSGRTKYGNNPLVGDVGNLSRLTTQAKTDGKELLRLLIQVLSELDRLEQQARAILESTPGSKQIPVPNTARMTCTNLMLVTSELRDYVTSLRPPSAADEPAVGDDEDLSVDAVRRRFEEQSGSIMDAVTSGLSSILPMLDPPLHPSIFGFDVQRGCTLARYQGARQIWIPRLDGGMIDVLHIPAPARARGSSSEPNPRAVMYCNPNAGLIEVAAGMSLAGGNVSDGDEEVVNDNCWADFYTNLGFDMYLFNYAGFGRSYGSTFCSTRCGGKEPHIPGVFGRIRRILQSTFCGFRPRPDSLRSDGQTVATYLATQTSVQQLVIHGESIGGVAASATANFLSKSTYKDKLALLICDRTFCNLEAVAQRLVGGWSGYAIKALAPLWSTDVAGDFVSAKCRKVVANDCADAIIADSSSLKSGIAFWKEIRHGGPEFTKGVGWMMEAPVAYRMADWENVCVNESKYVQLSYTRTQAPVWPADKHVTLEEAFHFAACVKRIGKMASLQKKMYDAGLAMADAERGEGQSGSDSPLLDVWKAFGCCDGLCGSALGMAVRGGFDVTVAWLCSALTFGGQTVIEAQVLRTQASADSTSAMASMPKEPIIAEDFDSRPPDFAQQENDTMVHPKPMPEVLKTVKGILEQNKDDEGLKQVKHEVAFCIGTIQYIIARLSSPQYAEMNWKNRFLQTDEGIGSFMNLHCGHNNPFTAAEKEQLQALLQHAVA